MFFKKKELPVTRVIDKWNSSRMTPMYKICLRPKTKPAIGSNRLIISNDRREYASIDSAKYIIAKRAITILKTVEYIVMASDFLVEMAEK
jgi:hypothetical protein